MQLRPYQIDCVNSIYAEIKKEDRALVVASTGSGKTIIFVKFSEMMDDLLRRAKREPFKGMVLVHKVDLVTQAEDKFQKAAQGIETGIVCGSLNQKVHGQTMTIASIDSIKNHPKVPFIHLLIVDEYHRFFYRPDFYEFRDKLLEVNPKMKTIYFTATPYGKTGYLYGETDSEVVEPCYRIGMKELIKLGHLVEPVFKEGLEKFDTSGLKESSTGDFTEPQLRKLVKNSKEKLKLQVTDALNRLQNRKKVIWCCTSIEHATDLEVELLSRQEAAIAVHSKQSIKIQERSTKAFEHGDIRHLVSVTKLSEGTDIPPIDAVVCMRPTRSPILYVQMVGRGLRPFPGKKDCLFLDYGGVVEALGHPSNPYIREKKKRRSGKPKALLCPSCFTMNFPPIDNCSECDYQFLKDERTIDRLKNLGLIPYDPDKKGKLRVLDWHIHWQYKSKKGKKMVLITYSTMKGPKKEFISREHENKYFRQFREDFTKGMPPYILMDSKNKFVKKRVYA